MVKQYIKIIILGGPWRTQYSDFYHIALLHYSWHEASMYNKLMSFQPLGITWLLRSLCVCLQHLIGCIFR